MSEVCKSPIRLRGLNRWTVAQRRGSIFSSRQYEKAIWRPFGTIKGRFSPLFRRSGLPGLGDAIHEIDEPVVVDAAVLGQADFAGAAGGNSFVTNLYCVFQGAQ